MKPWSDIYVSDIYMTWYFTRGDIDEFDDHQNLIKSWLEMVVFVFQEVHTFKFLNGVAKNVWIMVDNYELNGFRVSYCEKSWIGGRCSRFHFSGDVPPNLILTEAAGTEHLKWQQVAKRTQTMPWGDICWHSPSSLKKI